MKCIKNLLLAGFCFWATAVSAQPVIQLQTFATGFVRPVDLVSAGDDRLFVVEQRGQIHILDALGQKLPTPFLNIQSRVNSSANERGLLGLAFHPDYAQNGYFYVNYTNSAGHTRISRFSVNPGNPNTANPDSELVLLGVNQPYSNHNAGDLNFGPDGFLYFGLGDGGSGGDPQQYSQNRQSLLGKMIRIDVNSGSPYGIPASNPFINDPATLNEIWSIGLRNPWRFSFDRLTGDMWIGDVGQNAWEEIDFQPAGSPGGENYGWRCYEGNAPYNTAGCQGVSAYTAPVHVYANSFTNGCSVTGGFVYRGSEFPDLYGHYLYTDYCSGKIWSLTPSANGGWTNRLLLQGASNSYVSFGENHQGALFLLTLGGNVLRVRELCSAFQVSGQVTPVSCPGQATGSIALQVQNPGASFSITWSNGSNTAQVNGLMPGNYTVTVTNASNCSRVLDFTVSSEGPANIAPIAVQGNMLSIPDLSPFFSSVVWLLNGQPIPGANGLNLIVAETGSYAAMATSANGCTYLWAPVAMVISQILEPKLLTRFAANPNPVSEKLWVDIRFEDTQIFQVRAIDVSGRELWKSAEFAEKELKREFDFSMLPPGTYALVLQQGQRILGILQIVKQ
jgi:glucose/arabinose dehydrogenase